MKTLMLLRHAKSDWNDPSRHDHDRPLNARGQEAAARMARYLAEHGPRPDVIVCSSAARAQQTLAALLDTLKPASGAETDKRLYMATPGTLRSVMAELPDNATTALFIGHNPGLHDFSRELARAGDSTKLGALEIKFPTAALAVIVFDDARSWQDAARDRRNGHGRLVGFVRPKALD